MHDEVIGEAVRSWGKNGDCESHRNAYWREACGGM